jgi:tRNA(Phe) wybutosine-synthesizing methylase Tyw3
VNHPFIHARQSTVFSLQCRVILDALHQQDAGTSTGFHALAARRMSERALEALDTVALSDDPVEVTDHVIACDDMAESALNILRAYLKQRGTHPEDHEDDE